MLGDSSNCKQWLKLLIGRIARFLEKFVRYDHGIVSNTLFHILLLVLCGKRKNLPNLLERKETNETDDTAFFLSRRITISSIEILAADLYYVFRDWASNVWMRFNCENITNGMPINY